MQAARKLGPVSFLVLACSVLLLGCALFGGGPQEILGVLPAILLLLAPAVGRFPGERAIFRLARGRRRPRREPSIAGPPKPPCLIPSGRIALLATSRPLRGPPAPVLVSS